MRMKGKTIFNASFDVFAETYHTVRPGYPAQLYEDVNEVCGFDGTARLLEVGAGSGIATVELAKLGSKIVAIEPGSHLAAIAREQTKGCKNVEVREEAFEDFQSTGRFDAVLAFTSFHWLKGDGKYQRMLELLNDTGNLVLAWNYFLQAKTPVTAAVNEVYHQLLSDVYPGQMDVQKVNEGVFSVFTRREQRIIQNPLFYSAFMKKYLVEYNYDANTYPKLLNTYPKVVGVKEDRRERFLQRISEVVAVHGKISVPVLTSLIICRRKDHFLQAVADSGKE